MRTPIDMVLGSWKPHSNQEDQLGSLGCSHTQPLTPSSLRISGLGLRDAHSLHTRDHPDVYSGWGGPGSEHRTWWENQWGTACPPRGENSAENQGISFIHSFIHPGNSYGGPMMCQPLFWMRGLWWCTKQISSPCSRRDDRP